jgi:hypothetical protein
MASTIKVDKIAQSSGTPEFTIPTADGTAGQFLKTDGSGVLAFDTVTTNPLALTGSTNTWIPTITAADALTGTANFTYDGNILDVKNSGTASSIKLYCENANAHAQEIKAAPHAGSSAWTLTLPGAAPTVSGQVLSATTAGVASWVADAGKVLQVLQDEVSSTINTTSTTYVASGLSVTITPTSTSSRFILQCTGGTVWTTGVGQDVRTTFYVGGAEVTPNGPYAVYKQCNSVSPPMQSSHSMLMIHSPASVSAQTYTVYYKNSSGTVYFNASPSRVQLTVTELSS